jgi:3',5'-cyclic AMP phosphodiesterase CpdA
MNNKDSDSDGPKSAPLKKRNITDYVSGVIATAIIVFFPSVILLAVTDSLSNGLSAFIIFFAAFHLWINDIPPRKETRRFHSFIWLYAIILVIYCMVIIERAPWRVVAAALFSASIILFSFFSLIELAKKNFSILKEIDPIGPAMEKREDFQPLISHVTDIHITEADDVQRLEGGPGGHIILKKWLENVNKEKPKYLIISGDVTDTSKEIEWKRFENILAEKLIVNNLRIICAPGNHDLSTAYDSSRSNQPRLFYEFQTRICPSLLTYNGQKLADVIADSESQIAPFIATKAEQMREEFIVAYCSRPITIDGKEYGASIADTPARRMESALELANKKDWLSIAHDNLIDKWYSEHSDDFYPIQHSDEEQVAVIFILNSVIPSQALGSSALGRLGAEQMSRLESKLNSLPQWTRNVFIITHHAPFRHPNDFKFLFFKSLLDRRNWKQAFARINEFSLLSFEALETREFLNILSDSADGRQSVNFFLFCGHRHTCAAGHAGRVLAFEGCSFSDSQPITWLVFDNNGKISVYKQPL